MAKIGDKLGRYELVEQLGKGAAGTVFKAKDSLLGIDVCVKVLHPGLATQPGIIERFKRELLLARRIAHPSICKIFDINEVDGTHFLVMEYVQGETLSAILNREGRMEVAESVRVMRKVAEALAAAHSAGVVHRDIKPGNIIIGEGGKVTIVDFGVATAEDLDRLTRAGVVLGSRSYMAPETWQGKASTSRGDVWALGVILYGCVTGRLPYKGEGVVGVFDAIKNTKPVPPSAFNGDVHPDLEGVINKAMCVEEEDRYQDGGEVEQALAKLEFGVSPFTDPAGFSEGDATEVRESPSEPPVAAAAAVAAEEEPEDRTVVGAPSAALLAGERLHKPKPIVAAAAARDDSEDKTSVADYPPPAMSPAIPPRKHGKIEQTDDSFAGALGEARAQGPADVTIPPVDDAASLYAGDAGLVAVDPDIMSGTGAPTASLAGNGGDAAVSDMFDAAFSSEGDAVAPDALGGGMIDDAEDAFFGGDGAPSTNTEIAQTPLMTQDVPEGELDKLHGMNVMLGQNVVVGDKVQSSPEPGEKAMLGAGIVDLTASPDATAASDWEAKDSSEALGVTDGAALSTPAFLLGEPLDAAPPLAQGGLSLDDPPPPAPELTQIAPAPLAEYGVGEDIEAADQETAAVSRPSRSELHSSNPDLVPDSDERKPVFIMAAVAVVLLLLAGGVLFFLGSSGDDESSSGGDDVVVADGTPSPGNDDAPPAGDDAKPAGDDGAAGDEAGGDEAAGGWDFDGIDGAGDEEPAGDDTAPAADDTAPGADDPGADDWEVEDEEPAPVAKPAAATTPQPRPSGTSNPARSRYLAKKRALTSALARKGILPGDVSAVDSHRRRMAKSAKRKKYGDAASSADRALAAANSTKIDSAFVGKKLSRLNKRYDKVTNPAVKKKVKSTFAQVAKDFSKKNYSAANKRLNRAFAMLKNAR